MSGVIDTNILIYAVNRDADEHPAAREFVLSALTSADSWYLTEGIVYEFLRVSTHHKVFARPLSLRQATEWMSSLMRS